MNEKLMGGSKQNPGISNYCPLTGGRVLEYGSIQFSFSGLYVTWWHCPACNGWHLLTTKVNQEPEGSRVDPVGQPLVL